MAAMESRLSGRHSPDDPDGPYYDFLPSGMVAIIVIAVAEGISALLRRRHEALRKFIHTPEGPGAAVFRERRGSFRTTGWSRRFRFIVCFGHAVAY